MASILIDYVDMGYSRSVILDIRPLLPQSPADLGPKKFPDICPTEDDRYSRSVISDIRPLLPQSPADLGPTKFPDICPTEDDRYRANIIASVAPGIVVKYRQMYSEEVYAMRFAREVALVPVPKVLYHPPRRRRYKSEESSGVWYICMERCSGTSLDKVIESMAPEELDHIAEQLKAILKRMASVKANSLGSVSGGPYRNCFFPEYTTPKYAFSTTGEFLDHYRRTLLLCSGEAFTEKLLSQFPRNAATRFTHGDLLPKNIMVQGSTITSIIDWATGGFYPEFWEYCRMHDPCFMTPGWDRILRKVFPGEPRKTEIDSVRFLINVLLYNF